MSGLGLTVAEDAICRGHSSACGDGSPSTVAALTGDGSSGCLGDQDEDSGEQEGNAGGTPGELQANIVA